MRFSHVKKFVTQLTSLINKNKKNKKKRCYVHKIFITNHRWKVIISSKLNSKLNLLFYPSVLTNNNLLLRICCENVVDITFLIKNKIIYIYI